MDIAATLLLAGLFFYVASDDAKRPIMVDKQDYYFSDVVLQHLPPPPDPRERRTPIAEVTYPVTQGAYLKGSQLPVVMTTSDQRNIRLDNFE